MPGERGPAFLRTTICIPIALTGFLNQAGAVTHTLSRALDFKATLEKVRYVPAETGAGAGATQGIRVRRGNAAGTILATVTVTLANHVLGAAPIDGAVSAADQAAGLATFGDTDTFSITKDAGTVFTTAGGHLELVFRQRPQARA